MGLIESVHGGYIHKRRILVLSEWCSRFIPLNSKVLDVGCGDGRLARLITDKRRDISISGIDVHRRSNATILVETFDGKSIPYGEGSFDVVMLVDVLHHASQPIKLLREAVRVARQAILIKDHLLEGAMAYSTLRVMDWVGNARHGVPLPYNYWTLGKWHRVFGKLGLNINLWESNLRLYPFPADLIAGRSLHFVALLEISCDSKIRVQHDRIQQRKPAEQNGPHDAWEQAYLRFETPEEEIRKFIRRLRFVGAMKWPRNAKILELFCGRGNGLRALHQLGFSQFEGMDLSPSLAAEYGGPGKIVVGDCKQLPFENTSKDIVIVQGGLHHLPVFPDDLDRVLTEAARVLRQDGLLFVVEPWATPFLSLSHALCRARVMRALSPKIDALASMIHYEVRTYEQWLSQPGLILESLSKSFHYERWHLRWGKIYFVGRKRCQ